MHLPKNTVMNILQLNPQIAVYTPLGAGFSRFPLKPEIPDQKVTYKQEEKLVKGNQHV
jgi:hypothetical protein